MEDLLKLVTQKFGLSMDKARTAVSAVLGFVRGKLPGPAADQLDGALQKLGFTESLPEGVTDEAAVAKQAGVAQDKVGSLVQTVMSFLKEKVPGGLGDLEGMLKGGGGGLFQKIAGLFGKS
jgi:hypothetical protein